MRKPLAIGTEIQLNESGTDKITVFKITELIGTGASCIVYTAEYRDGTGNAFLVRLKEFCPDNIKIDRKDTELMISDEDIFSELLIYFTSGYTKQLEFRKNAEQMNSISNIQGVYTGNHTVYIAMSCNTGACLTAEQEYSFIEIMRIIRAVTIQIRHFHDNGYLYLDLKPNNIFLYPETPDMVMLFDFDSVIRKEDIIKHSEWLSFTEEWSAPELVRNQISKIDERADIYAVGALLLFLLFRRSPVPSDRRRWNSWDDEMQNSIISKESPEVKKMLTQILQKTLTSNVQSRFADCHELLTVIESYLEKILAPKPYLKTALPIGNNYFCGRDREIAEIHDILQNETSFLILHGIGGIGKSELAKHYALAYSEHYHAVIFVHFQKNMIQTIISDINFPVVNCKRSEEEEDLEYFHRKLEVLQAVCTPEHLIILDNFDTEECEDMDYLTGLQCKILVTSRVDYSDVFRQLDIDVLDDEDDLYQIITYYYKPDIDEVSEKAIIEIISAVQGHTMALELIAKHMQMMKINPAEMNQLLIQNGITAGNDGKVRNFKDGNLKNTTAYAHISALFNIFGLSEEMKQILRHSALIGANPIEVYDFVDYLELTDEQIAVLNSLINCGWIQYVEIENSEILSLHPLIADVLCNELKPDITHCGDFIFRTVEIVEEIHSFNYDERNLKIAWLNHMIHHIHGNAVILMMLLDSMSSNIYMIDYDFENAEWCHEKIIRMIAEMHVQKEYQLQLLNSYLLLRKIDTLNGRTDRLNLYEDKIKELDIPLSSEYLDEVQCNNAIERRDYHTAIQVSHHRLDSALKTAQNEQIALAYHQLGDTEYSFEHDEKAHEYYGKASEYIAEYLKEISNSKKLSDEEKAHKYGNAGNFHSDAENNSAALECYYKSIELFNSEYGENNSYSTMVYSSVAEIYRKLNDIPLQTPLSKFFEKIK